MEAKASDMAIVEEAPAPTLGLMQEGVSLFLDIQRFEFGHSFSLNP